MIPAVGTTISSSVSTWIPQSLKMNPNLWKWAQIFESLKDLNIYAETDEEMILAMPEFIQDS